jgi:energy-coupling factor transporter transmembrane protein EcfT
MDPSKLPEFLLIWAGAIGLLVFVRERWHMPGTGLTLAYLFNLSLIHWVGAAVYVLPAYESKDLRFTEMGFEQSFYGMLAFCVGSVILTPVVIKMLPRAKVAHRLDSKLPKVYMVCGVIFYLLSSTFLAHVPTLSAIVASGQQLVIVGLVLCCWMAWREGKRWKLTAWLALSLLLPFATVITAGMLGYGVIAVMTILIFVSALLRSPKMVAFCGVVAAYVGLSVFVSYMRDRDDIRASVWGGQSFTDRIDRVAETFATFEWFDPANQEHLKRIDSRLNQNFLVGAAVINLTQAEDYAHGDTLWDALLAPIPRAIWPDKPTEAGSGDLVTRYTGIDFAPGTSVGVGQVMEFYANFGTPGVVLGFLIMGVIITGLDWQAAERLQRSDLRGFVLWYLPGIAFLQVGGQLVELTASAAASLAVALLLNRYLDSWYARSATIPLPYTPAVPRLRSSTDHV